MRPLSLVSSWPVGTAAAATVRYDGTIERIGPSTNLFHLASLSKVLSTWAILIAVEDGSISLDAPVGQPGCTLRHLLSHAGGYPFEGETPILGPQRRRIYSNTGIDIAARAVSEATGIDFGEYVTEAVLEPLDLSSTEIRGSASNGMWGTVDDIARFLVEMIAPTLLSRASVTEATTIQYPGLAGRLPGMGIFDPCPWGLGAEIKGSKHPHWMGTTNSPASFGHFGGSGTMMWVDPVAKTSVVALTDRRFDEWALSALRVWPELSDAIIADAAG
jgi:CubicO group peptidase (beta-lactamase class C family)